MRRLTLLISLVVTTPMVLAATTRDALADFDPGGRKKPGKPEKPGKPGKPEKPEKKPPKDPDKKGPSAEVLIERYTKLAIANPADPFPVQRLAQEYRQRDGNLKKLVEDFDKRVAAKNTESWAAKVVLAGVYKHDGKLDEAIKTYQAAIDEKPKEPAPLMALANLEVDKGDRLGAKGHYEKALPLIKGAAEIEQLNRVLMGLCIELKDYAVAKKYHEALVKAAGNSLFVKAEYGRELMRRAVYDKAEDEFRDVVKAASGDNRVLAPALRDLGAVLAKRKKMEEALTTLKRAYSLAGEGAGVRNEILVIMTDAYRADGKLTALIAIIEAEKPGDFQRLAALGALYEETGQVTKAVAIYRKALAKDSKQIDTRLKLVHLLQAAGELDAAIKEYEALIKAAPHNPEFVFELCETYIQRGERAKALKLVTDLETRVSNDPELLLLVADFYERVEEKEKALKIFTKLAQTGTDPQHIIDLGDRYFQAGNKQKALEVWARLKTVIPNKSKAAVTLGEVYLDHDMPNEGLASIREAMDAEPNNVRHKKAYADALERSAPNVPNTTQRYAEALAVWEQLLAGAAADPALARDSRKHIVNIWASTKELAAKIPGLQAKLDLTPPDLEQGRLLAEVQRRLNRMADAEVTLRKLIKNAPGDEDSYLALENALVRQQKQQAAIDILEKLVEVNPKRALEVYQRMAQYAAELYKDDDAIKYAAKAVSLSPNNAGGHKKLGDMHRRRQDNAKAIAEYRLAITQSNLMYDAYFDLAELLLGQGEPDEADRLLRHIVRSARDEELVQKAARMSMQVNLGKGTLEQLERELLPVAVGNPTKTIYRRLLVELYGAMTFPLVQKLKVSKGTNPKDRDAARAELARIGTRAVKPLLDALGDDRESQQKIAIEVLAYVDNKNAGLPLYNFATGTADKGLRTRAMIACGALRAVDLMPKYEQLLAPKDGKSVAPGNDPLALAAAWGVARMGDRKAEPLLSKLLASGTPEIRALAALGLGVTKDKKHAAVLVGVVKSPESGPMGQAAAIEALSELGALASLDKAVLRTAGDSPDPVLRRTAILALARAQGKDDPTKSGGLADTVAAAAFSQHKDLREASALAAGVLTGAQLKRTHEAMPVPDGPLQLSRVLESFGPDTQSAKERAAAFVAFAPALQRAAVAAVATSPERGRAVADALLKRRSVQGLVPFAVEGDVLDDKQRADVNAALEKIAAAVAPSFVSLVRHPSIDVRSRAVEFLASRPEKDAQKAVADALSDPEEVVRRSALGAIGDVSDEGTAAAVMELAKKADSWSVRVRAAEALGRLGAKLPAGAGRTKLGAELGSLAKTDEFALVREAAVRALSLVDPAGAPAVLREIEKADVEKRVRVVAAELLAKK